MATISLGVKIKVLIYALNDLTLAATPPTFSHTIHPLFSRHTGLIATPPTGQPRSHHRAFVLVPSTLNPPAPGILCLLVSLSSGPSSKSYCLSKAVTDRPVVCNNPHTRTLVIVRSQSPFPASFFFSAFITILQVI